MSERSHHACQCTLDWCRGMRSQHLLQDKIVAIPLNSDEECDAWCRLLCIDRAEMQRRCAIPRVWVGHFQPADMIFDEQQQYRGLVTGMTRHRGYGRNNAVAQSPPQPTATQLKIRSSDYSGSSLGTTGARRRSISTNSSSRFSSSPGQQAALKRQRGKHQLAVDVSVPVGSPMCVDAVALFPLALATMAGKYSHKTRYKV
ncbi:hypothetical protein B484DRAFT_40620 [Ochromonadaceae sp. CCMP2298]|nr:hypothetical protein B484DRAFT_40620 [Ochromonadaceae sp. CCMP2298]|eukprot:CAMPEP_0173269374 /NCGR_PEP_ID=MMETSP1142-20121109/30843_1 /TAXON_ID=483371 /ORGANISM="non described non described, Strain CCMP2298" /LENGTH=200 /DNA_ID=CAMNT_0014205713 /DNA_START=105 /DNA_END=707 /DNA_ORIENTATION=-